MASTQRPARKTRREKAADGTQRVTREKFQGQNNPAPIVAKTEKQKKYLQMLNDPSVQVVV